LPGLPMIFTILSLVLSALYIRHRD